MRPDYYTFTGETTTHKGRILHQIQATRDIEQYGVKSGDIGGYIGQPENLTEESWVLPSAKVYGHAHVRRQSLIAGSAVVRDNAFVSDSFVSGTSVVDKKACVTCRSSVDGRAHITDESRIKNYSRAGGNAVATGRSVVTNASVVEGDTCLEHTAYVSNRAWVRGEYVLRDPSHCMMHTINTPKLSATFTLARGESGQGLVRVHESWKDSPITLDELTESKMVRMLHDPDLRWGIGFGMPRLDAMEFVDEFRLMRDMFAARVARWA